MRAFAVVFLLLTSLVLDCGALPAGLERVTAYGSAYYRLSQWASSYGMRGNWDKKAGTIELTRGSDRVLLTINSRKASINNQTILLSLPVIARGDVALISAVDAQTTFDPVISPKTGGSVKLVCLDPGHGGKDTGKIDGKNMEKKYTLLLAKEVSDLLKKRGIKVVMTRTRDQTLELSDRPALAKRKGADLFVSLHYNAASSDVQGVEIYCLSPAGVASSNEGGGRAAREGVAGNIQNSRNMLLAYKLQKSILKGAGLEDRGLKRARFEVLREARVPAVLIEGGFMTNPADAKKVYDNAFRKKMAQAIVDGILDYKAIIEAPKP